MTPEELALAGKFLVVFNEVRTALAVIAIVMVLRGILIPFLKAIWS